MNILIPLAGTTAYADGQILPLVEVFNKTLIEYVISNLGFGADAKFVFVVKKEDCDKHYLDSILDLLRPGCSVVRTHGETAGQLCSCLMAIEQVDNDEPLLIVNGNQFLFDDIPEIVDGFVESGADGGIITFPNIHPRWSYVRVAEDGTTVLETSEKRPISKRACAGIFYYKKGSDFIAAGKDVIRKDTKVGDLFYVSSTYNAMILRGKSVVTYEVEGDAFCSMRTEQGVRSFVATLQERVA